MENPNKNKAYFLWDVFQKNFLERNLSLTHHISYKYYFFFFTLYSRGKQLILAPTLSHSLTVSSQFSLFSLLFLSSHILTISPLLVPPLFCFHRSLSICLSQSTTLPCTGNISFFSTKTPILYFAFYVTNDIYSNFIFLLVS